MTSLQNRRTVFRVIYEEVHHLHHRFQREIAREQYLCACCDQAVRHNSRKWRYCNNKLIRLLMMGGKTEGRTPKRSLDSNAQKETLLQKLS